MKDENLGLVAGLTMMASITAVLLEHKAVGLILGAVGLSFAIALGLSKRKKGRAIAENRKTEEN